MEPVKAVREGYGLPESLEMQDLETPEPGDHEVLIKVMAASVNRSDWESLIGKSLYTRIGPRSPILGTDVAGEIVQVGSAVTGFQPGDHVFGDIMYHRGSAFAEYVSVPDTAPLAHKPLTVSFAEASTLPQAGLIAFQGIPESIGPGQRVLINGAGGGAGSFAVQLAKASGAHVTAVDNGLKQEYMSALGADTVFDYTRADYTKDKMEYDLILDVFCERSMFAIRQVLAPGGTYSAVGGSVTALLSALVVGRVLSTGGRTMGVLMVKPRKEHLARLAQQVATGDLKTNIERTYSLAETPEALRHLGEGRALGKLVIEIG